MIIRGLLSAAADAVGAVVQNGRQAALARADDKDRYRIQPPRDQMAGGGVSGDQGDVRAPGEQGCQLSLVLSVLMSFSTSAGKRYIVYRLP
ncbi:hypothetical protein [Plantactinospora sp. DSM 117369]